MIFLGNHGSKAFAVQSRIFLTFSGGGMLTGNKMPTKFLAAMILTFALVLAPFVLSAESAAAEPMPMEQYDHHGLAPGLSSRPATAGA